MEKPKDEILKYREDHYTPFEDTLSSLVDIIEKHNLADSWFLTMLTIRRLEKAVEKDDIIPELANFVTSYSKEIKNILLKEIEVSNIEDPYLSAHEVIHSISRSLEMEDQYEEMEIKTLSIEELNINDRIEIKEGDNFLEISIYSRNRDRWYSYYHPKEQNGNKLLAKGGLSRVLLKILADAPEETIEAELPLNDLDFIAMGDMKELYRMAKIVGGDEDGVEVVEELNYSKIFRTRDLDLNGCLFSEKGLFYSDEAYQAAMTGKIAIAATKRGLYGTEIFHFDGDRKSVV